MRPSEEDCGGHSMSDELWEMALKCWVKEPSGRPSMESLLDTLEVAWSTRHDPVIQSLSCLTTSRMLPQMEPTALLGAVSIPGYRLDDERIATFYTTTDDSEDNEWALSQDHDQALSTIVFSPPSQEMLYQHAKSIVSLKFQFLSTSEPNPFTQRVDY
jgi:hypothetical protein